MKRTTLAVAIALLLAEPAVHAQHAHVHGTAQLAVSVEGNMLQLDFDSPLENLIGFEHAPRNERERQAVQRMMNTLRRPEMLFVPTGAARCVPENPQITMPFSDIDGTKASKPDDYADVEATFTFRCETPSRLNDIEARLLDAFPGVKKVNVQLVTPRGQAAAILADRQRKLPW